MPEETLVPRNNLQHSHHAAPEAPRRMKNVRDYLLRMEGNTLPSCWAGAEVVEPLVP